MSPDRDRAPRYLVLGGGAVVRELYLPAFQSLGWLERVTIADPSERALRRLAEAATGVQVLQADFRTALEQAARDGVGVGAVVVALPNVLHAEAVQLALRAGFDVLCEKPLALTAAECRHLACAADRAGRILAVGMMRRFLPAVAVARGVLAAGWLGDLASVEVEEGYPFSWPTESGAYFRAENAGVLANFGVHSLDLLEQLCGPLAPVAYEDDWRGGAEANATFTLRTSSGVPVTLALSSTHQLGNRFRLHGSAGELSFDRDETFVTFDGLATGLKATVEGAAPNGVPPIRTAFIEEFLDFEHAITSRDSPAATAHHAIPVAALIDWAYGHHCTTTVSTTTGDPRLQTVAQGRAVVTGGTGFVGGHLLEALSALGNRDVVVPVRSYQSGANAARFPIRFERASLLDRRDMAELLRGARYVFHLAYGRDGDDAGRVTVEGTKNLVEAAIKAGVESVVIVSTTTVFGDPGGIVDETFPYAPVNRTYERSKAAAEKWTLERAADAGGTRISVVNAGHVYGPRGTTFTELPARLLAEGKFCWIEDGLGLVNYVYVSDLVDALLLAAIEPQAHARRFIAVEDTSTWREFYTELFGAVAAGLTSYRRADLIAMQQAKAPRLRDVARSVAASDTVRHAFREHRGLAAVKTAGRRWLPGVYSRVKVAGGGGRVAPATPASAAPVPPEYLADLFGPSQTRFSSTRARTLLGWRPVVDLRHGQLLSRRWLEAVCLWARSA